MGAWQVKTLATCAVLTAAITIAAQTGGSLVQHALTEGVHLRADIAGRWVIEWRLEPASIHAESVGCSTVGEVSP